MLARFIPLLALLAIPALAETINLSNGNGIDEIDLQVNGSDSDLVRRTSTDCKGSSLCSNGQVKIPFHDREAAMLTPLQSFKNDCQDAYNKIEDTTYTTGGTKAGTCAGYCVCC